MKNAEKITRPRKSVSLSSLERMPWTQAVQDVPVGHAIQYRDQATGEVVYWHVRQPSIQSTLKLNKTGLKSKVRQTFSDLVNNKRLFITHCP